MSHKILSLLLLVIFCQCCSTIYIPTPLVPTGFKEKKELSASGMLGLGGFAANVAYSPVKNFFVHSAGTFIRATGNSNFHGAFNSGAGIYLPIKTNTVIELQGSGGLGSFKFADQFNGSNYSLTGARGKYKNWNGALSISHAPSGKGHIGIAFRYGNTYVSYRGATYDHLSGKTVTTRQIGYYMYHRSPLSDQIYLIGSYGRYVSDGQNETIRSNQIDLRIGLEFRLSSTNSKN